MYSVSQYKSHLVLEFLGLKLKIKNEAGHPEFPKRKIEPAIKNYKFVHIMNNGLHSVSIIKFINKYFPDNQHCFIFPIIMFEKTKEKLHGEKNIFYCPIRNIDTTCNEKIIIHGLFDKDLIKALYKYKVLLHKTYWFIWGGDLYAAKDDKKNNYVRQNIAGILTSFDKEVYENKYGKCKSCFDITYPHDVHELMTSTENAEQKDYVHIQINNSSDETTLEMLDILSKFKDENIKVSTILSYGTVGQRNVKEEIIDKGYEIFSDKFNPVIEFMPRADYAKFLASVDIYISNQNRQQGNGNAAFICSLGKKVYVKSDTSVYKKYNSLGIRYYDTYKIPKMDFEEFCYLDKEETDKSVKLLKERMKNETKVKQWKYLFDYDDSTIIENSEVL